MVIAKTEHWAKANARLNEALDIDDGLAIHRLRAPSRIDSHLPERPEFKSFAQSYAEKIQPFLLEKEAELTRIEAALKRNRNPAIALALLGLLGPWRLFLGNGYFGSFLSTCLLLGSWAAAAGLMLPHWRAKARERRGVKSEILQFVATELGLNYRNGHRPPVAFKELLAWNLLPQHDKAYFDDSFSGAWRGVDFTFCEVRLTEERGSGKSRREVTVFQGHVIKTHFQEKLFGRTVIAPRRWLNNGHLRRYRKAGLRDVGFVSRKFEEIFDVFGSDQMEARYILDPVQMETMMALAGEQNGKGLRAIYSDQDIIVAFPGQDYFELDRDSNAIADPALMGRILRELDAVFNLIDLTLKRRDEN